MSLTRTRPQSPFEFMPEVAEMPLVVVDGEPHGSMAVRHRAASHGGSDVSPGLSWQRGPAGTESYAITCYDIDAPTPAGVWHWFVCDIPADVTSLPVDAAALPGLGVGARTLRNDLGTEGYVGAAPPDGDHTHRYIFSVHALGEATLGAPEGASLAVAGFFLTMKTLARGSFIQVV